jgi:hypothetical protein
MQKHNAMLTPLIATNPNPVAADKLDARQAQVLNINVEGEALSLKLGNAIGGVFSDLAFNDAAWRAAA